MFPEKNDRVSYPTQDSMTGKAKTLYGTVQGFHDPSGAPMVLFDGEKEPSRIPARELMPVRAWKVGDKVEAVVRIVVEQLVGKRIKPDHVTATPGDKGKVEYVDDDGVPTVRFQRTGYATIVGDNEVKLIAEAKAA